MHTSHSMAAAPVMATQYNNALHYSNEVCNNPRYNKENIFPRHSAGHAFEDMNISNGAFAYHQRPFSKSSTPGTTTSIRSVSSINGRTRNPVDRSQVASEHVLFNYDGSNDGMADTRASQLRSHSTTKTTVPRTPAMVRQPSRLSSQRSISPFKFISDPYDALPPQDTATYQGLDLRKISLSLSKRKPRRRAVIVGVNYASVPMILLRGCCNDACATALALVNLCDFNPEDIILLIDAFPAEIYRTSERKANEVSGEPIVWKNRQPTRHNILLALNWLRSDTMPGDVILFYYAGHGLQVDDMSGREGEGYDEAILPMDFCGEEVNAITAVMIRNILLNVENDVQITIIVDCNGGQTMLDPSGTGGWSFIKGVKQRGVWPLITDVKDKVARAVYDPTAWTDKIMKKRGARPRFVPGIDISSAQELLDPVLQKPGNQVINKVKGYLFASAPWSQSAIEVKIQPICINPITRDGQIIQNEKPEKSNVYHGVFTWCFLHALQHSLIECVQTTKSKMLSYQRLIKEVEKRIRACRSRQGGLPKLNQLPELTFYRPGGSDPRDYFLWPFGGRKPQVPYVDDTTPPLNLPCDVHEQQYLSIWDAEEQLRALGENKRKNDPAFLVRNASLSASSLPKRLPEEKSTEANTSLSQNLRMASHTQQIQPTVTRMISTPHLSQHMQSHDMDHTSPTFSQKKGPMLSNSVTVESPMNKTPSNAYNWVTKNTYSSEKLQSQIKPIMSKLNSNPQTINLSQPLPYFPQKPVLSQENIRAISYNKATANKVSNLNGSEQLYLRSNSISNPNPFPSSTLSSILSKPEQTSYIAGYQPRVNAINHDSHTSYTEPVPSSETMSDYQSQPNINYASGMYSELPVSLKHFQNVVHSNYRRPSHL